MEKYLTIKCPKCGCEYLPCEIFTATFPDKAKGIVKDNKKIIHVGGYTPFDLTETYNCDECGTTFSISGKIDFTTYIVEEPQEVYTTELFTDRAELNER